MILTMEKPYSTWPKALTLLALTATSAPENTSTHIQRGTSGNQ